MKEKQWTCPVRPDEIPKEYNYVAQDKCGEWYAFEEEPIPFETISGWCIPQIGVFFTHLLYIGEYNADWRKTLTKITR